MSKLINTVIENDYCIGCGACALVDGSPFEMKMDENGKYRAFLTKDIMTANDKTDKVCPFYSNENETNIGYTTFTDENIQYNEYTGYYLQNFVGYVKEGSFREKGSSGGMGNWIAAKLLEENLVDGIIHVKESQGKGEALFEYQISKNIDDLYKGAKSKYYPVELSKVLRLVKENEGRYALIGIPCFIKSIRLLAKQDKLISKRIKFFIGLVCGHLKSDMFAKSIGWQLGIHPDDLTNIDFRKKLPGRGANDYGVEVFGNLNNKNTNIISPTKELFTTNWGQGYFKYNACEYCDDVLAETADITVGDAWLPGYQNDHLGTNIVTVRNKTIINIIEKGISEKQINLQEVNPETIYDSQAGGFRHRRDGLAYRLYLKDKNNEWRPEKRVQAANNLHKTRKKIYKQRMILSKKSFLAYKKAYSSNNFTIFKDEMTPLVNDYKKLLKVTFLKKVLGRIRRTIK